ncbi:E3 ubiquitin-protein ligase RING1-like isoform X2 [Malania oleifera]|nr:E3 ubiquitin-protein ligase RING1-like isoform X2 [Malania oleifera]
MLRLSFGCTKTPRKCLVGLVAQSSTFSPRFVIPESARSSSCKSPPSVPSPRMSFSGIPGTDGAGGVVGGAATGPQNYFCHQCNRTVSVVSSSDVRCSVCYGGFVEEHEQPPNPNPNPNPFITFSDSPSISARVGGGGGLPLIFSTTPSAGSGGGVDFQNASDFSNLFGGERAVLFQDPDAFNPFLFLQNYLQTMRPGGANIQFVIDNNTGDPAGGGLRLPANLGDYFIGPGLEQLIQQLAENDPNRYGTPPASKSAVEALPEIKITEELLSSDSSQCAVCKDTFELGAEAKQMPCKHIYHPDCILPWLGMHNSCPVCRYELPTEDPDYEHGTRETRVTPNSTAVGGLADSSSSSATGAGATSQESGQTPRTAERRFRIPLYWPFRMFGSSAETSNSNSGNNDGESNSAGRGNRDFGAEGRQEDLD